jgi:hypothetical protein
MQAVQTAQAKIVLNRKLNTVRILVAFNVYKNADGKYAFPPQRSCAYVSGDMRDEDVAAAAVRIGKSLNAELQFVAA